MRFHSSQELNGLRASLVRSAGSRRIWVCGGPGCVANGSEEVLRAFKAELARSHNAAAALSEDGCACGQAGLTGCTGPCELGPVIQSI